MVPLQTLRFFCSDMKIQKWRLRQDLVLTLDPMGKNVFKNASSLKTTWTVENQNCPGMIIGRSLYKFFCFFYADRKSKMAATAGHRLTLDPMGKMFQMPSSQKTTNMIKAKTVHECSLDGPSTNFRFFFVPI